MVKRRRVVAHIALQHSPALVPALEAPLPLAVHATPAAPAAVPLLLRGRLFTDDHDLILARQQGRNLTGGWPRHSCWHADVHRRHRSARLCSLTQLIRPHLCCPHPRR